MLSTREKIIMEALRCFLEYDYEQVTLNQIAGNINITKGGIYHYFSSKDQLLKEVVLAVVRNTVDHFMRWVDTRPSLEVIIQAMFSPALHQENMKNSLGSSTTATQEKFIYLFFLATRKHPALKENIARTFTEFINFLEGAIAQAQMQGEISSQVDCRIAAYYLTALSKGTSLLNFYNPEYADTLLEPVAAMLFAQLGLAPACPTQRR